MTVPRLPEEDRYRVEATRPGELWGIRDVVENRIVSVSFTDFRPGWVFPEITVTQQFSFNREVWARHFAAALNEEARREDPRRSSS